MSRGARDDGLAFWAGDLLVGVGLFALLGLMVLAAHLPLGAARVPVIGGLAGLEALLVGVVSMKLRRAPALVVLAAVAGLFFLAALFTMTLTDYPFRQNGERPQTFPAAEGTDAPLAVGANLPDR